MKLQLYIAAGLAGLATADSFNKVTDLDKDCYSIATVCDENGKDCATSQICLKPVSKKLYDLILRSQLHNAN